MRLDENFNSSEHKPTGYEPLKKGNYQAKITSIDLEDTRAGDGTMFVVAMQVQGRRIRDWIREHPSTKAVAIASVRLASLCQAAGIECLTDTDQLVGAEVAVELSVNGTYNQVRSYDCLRPVESSYQFSQPRH